MATTTAEEHPSGHSGHSKHHGPSARSIIAIVVIVLALGVLILYSLFEFWPTGSIVHDTGSSELTFLGYHTNVSLEVRLFVVVALAGTLGAILHSMRSLAWYVGHQKLRWRWIPYYVVTLLLGAGLSTIVYIVVRGGLLTTSTENSSVNPYGFAAIGALTGLFTEQALEMLRKVATDFFAPAPQGPDGVTDQGKGKSPDPGPPPPKPGGQ